MDAVTGLFEEIVDPLLYVRRIYVTANNIISNTAAHEKQSARQLSLFDDFGDGGGRDGEKANRI